jgi:hypothetical protein
VVLILVAVSVHEFPFDGGSDNEIQIYNQLKFHHRICKFWIALCVFAVAVAVAVAAVAVGGGEESDKLHQLDNNFVL